MEQISQQKLEDLIKPTLHSSICILSSSTEKNGSRYSFTPLYACVDGVGSPQARGFRNGHYAGVLLMPKNEEEIAYFSIFEGNISAALEDKNIILRLINTHAMFPERRPKQVIFCNEIKRPYN